MKFHQRISRDLVHSVPDQQTLDCHVQTQPEAPLTASGNTGG